MEKVISRSMPSYRRLNNRKSRRKSGCEIDKVELRQDTEEEDDEYSSRSSCCSREKGPSNGKLLGGPADPSGCPSTTLSKGNSSARPTTPEKLQSMPVTSRSKRLRGATTSSQHNNKIAFTDRKTRSASSSLNLDSTIIIKSENPSESSDSLRPEDSRINDVRVDRIVNETKIFGNSSEEKSYCGHENEFDTETCTTEIDQCKEGILSETVKPEVPSEANFAKIATKATTPSGSSDWNTSTSTNTTNESSHYNDVTNDIYDGVKVIDQRSEIKQRGEGNNNNKSSTSFKSDVVESSRKRSKAVVNDQKLTLAPMLLMNNLPYMGELTFDTRPRRGRKPKKADICHLISKNYGIHFPNSYTNVPNTGTPPSTAVAAPSYPSTKIRTKVNPSIKGKSSKKSSSKSGAFSTCPPPTWTISPPDLLPISSSGQNRILGSSNTSSFTTSKISASLNKPPQSVSKVSSNSCIKSIKLKNHPNPLISKGAGQVEPLNLCVRDASSHMKSQSNHPILSDFNASYAGIMNLKLPLTSPNTLFSDFHLNQVGSRMSQTSEGTVGLDESIRKSRNPPGGGSGNKNAKGRSTDKINSDSSLVNNINFQLNQTNNFHGNGPILTKSQGKMSHPLRFVPPHTQTVEEPGFINKDIQSKKARKRKSPTLKPDNSNQIEIKSPSSSSNVFLNSSSVSSSVVSNLESHAGGCLFGQSDSGMNAGGAQVSICKFKFTGGAKPSLQEKKMLSVDSGGNFRFYTDKCGSSSIKSLKSCHSGINQGSTTPFHNSSETYGEQDCQYAFSALPKSAKSMSVCMPVRSSSLQTPYSSVPVSVASSSTSRLLEAQKSPPMQSVSPTSMELHNLHLDTNSRSGSGSGYVPSTFPCEDGYSSSQSDNSNSGTGLPSESACGSSLSAATINPYQNEGRSKLARFKRKRRTRKSLMREKLEKTFKEKGFLIQTQQLESAEGATYCKFRQLRKFTRYLFRSWKDYLPDNVRDINAPGANKGEGSGTSINLATSSAGGNPEGGESGSGMEMELDLTTTNSQGDLNGSREDSDEEDNEEDCEEGMEQYSDRITPVVPDEVPLNITQPTSPVKNHSSNNSNKADDKADDSAVSNDEVDVENIDATSDNSSLQYNASINIEQEDNNDNSQQC